MSSVQTISTDSVRTQRSRLPIATMPRSALIRRQRGAAVGAVGSIGAVWLRCDSPSGRRAAAGVETAYSCERLISIASHHKLTSFVMFIFYLLRAGS